jgi:hypothetical protein
VRTGRCSPRQARVHAGRVEVDATSCGNGAQQAAARALSSAFAGIVRMNEPVGPSRLGCLQELGNVLGGG